MSTDHSHPGMVAAGLVASWGATLSSFFLTIMPILQGISLIAATVASVAAVRYYRARRLEKRSSLS
jgi:hypothetical protein